jgi:hypothetical protein
MNATILRAAAAGLAATLCGSAAFAQTSSSLREILIAGLPPEVTQIGVEKTVADMLSDGKRHMANTKPLSEAFDPLTALRSVGTPNLTADQSCFRDKAVGGDPDAPNDADCYYRQGSPQGEGPYVSLRVNLFKGKFAYLNRSRSFITERNPNGITLSTDKALTFAQGLQVAFGIPASEIDKRYIDVRGLHVAGADAKEPPAGTTATPHPTGVLAEVHVRFPRAIPDGGGNPKWPVFDSQFMVAVTGSDARQQAARVRGQWHDFGLLLPAVQPVSNAQLLDSMLGALEGSINPATLEFPGTDPKTGKLKGTRSFVAFVPIEQMEACRVDPGDEKAGEEQTRVQDLRRLYVPALVLFAIPQDPGEVPRQGQEPRKVFPSTGIAQMSFPLVDLRGFCDVGTAPQ